MDLGSFLLLEYMVDWKCRISYIKLKLAQITIIDK